MIGAAAEHKGATAGLKTRARLSYVGVVCCPREGEDMVEGLLLAEAGRILWHCVLVHCFYALAAQLKFSVSGNVFDGT